jgi:hypothetical protein
MKHLDTQDQYDEFLETVVTNRNQRDPSPAAHVANILVVSTRPVGDEIALTTTAEPYYMNTITPTSAILHTHQEAYPGEFIVNGLRAGAVELLSRDLRQHEHWRDELNKIEERADG